jgi:hypothetical protein
MKDPKRTRRVHAPLRFGKGLTLCPSRLVAEFRLPRFYERPDVGTDSECTVLLRDPHVQPRNEHDERNETKVAVLTLHGKAKDGAGGSKAADQNVEAVLLVL